MDIYLQTKSGGPVCRCGCGASGCLSAVAYNYNPEANQDDGSCYNPCACLMGARTIKVIDGQVVPEYTYAAPCRLDETGKLRGGCPGGQIEFTEENPMPEEFGLAHILEAGQCCEFGHRPCADVNGCIEIMEVIDESTGATGSTGVNFAYCECMPLGCSGEELTYRLCTFCDVHDGTCEQLEGVKFPCHEVFLASLNDEVPLAGEVSNLALYLQQKSGTHFTNARPKIGNNDKFFPEALGPEVSLQFHEKVEGASYISGPWSEAPFMTMDDYDCQRCLEEDGETGQFRVKEEMKDLCWTAEYNYSDGRPQSVEYASHTGCCGIGDGEIVTTVFPEYPDDPLSAIVTLRTREGFGNVTYEWNGITTVPFGTGSYGDKCVERYCAPPPIPPKVLCSEVVCGEESAGPSLCYPRPAAGAQCPGTTNN